ncbi:hypothetical protein GCM10010468_64590 [Actinocorallia longicatena]|uniref:OmpR/PhoB-type domain-containing protein n=1 Tax=Actinocorallia longicatena TaxID=111803 RepID=A0ABP6QPF5_9ACTN
MDTDLRFCVLGPLQAWRGDEAIPLGPPKQRQVLARLLMAGGETVARESLIAALWPGGAPLSAHKAVHGYVGRLRRLLEPGLPPRGTSRLLVNADGGYALRAGRSDLAALGALAEQAADARRRADAGRERLLLIEALAQRRGTLLEGLDLTAWPEAGRLDVELRETFDRLTARLRELDAALVGRDVDLRYLAEIVPSWGAVTLVGPGGVGKTALSRELAARLGAGYRSVLLVELGPLPPDASLDTAAELVRTALGVERDRDGALPAVLRALRTGDVLLVLDNAEHLTGGARQVVEEIVRTVRTAHANAGESAHVVITSRVPLGTPGEQVWRVPTLATNAAVELLHGRPNVVETPVMAELVDALGGLPLAIELAGAMLRDLPAERIRDHLVRRRDLHEAFGLPWPTLDWVPDLLPGRERLLLSRLTVFPGGAGREAVREVCSHPPLTAEEIPGLLTTLAEGRLIGPDGGVRAGLRDLCAARADDLATMKDRHLAHCLVGAFNGRTSSTTDALTALSWALRPGSGPAAVQAGAELIDAGWRVFTDGEAGAEPVLAWTLRALDHPAGLPTHLCGLLNLRAGRLQMRMGRPAKARPHFDRAVTLFDLGAEGLRRRAEVLRHLVALDLTEAHPSIEVLVTSAAAEARASGDVRALTGSLPFLALAFAWLGRDEQALALVGEAEAAGRLAHPEHAAFVYLRTGRPAETLARTAALTGRGGLVGAQALLAEGWALMVQGDLPGARAALHRGEDRIRRSQTLAVLPDFQEAFAHAARLGGDLDEAWSHTLRGLRRCVEQQDVLTGTRLAFLTLDLARYDHRRAAEIAATVREVRLRTNLPAWPYPDSEVARWEHELGAVETPPSGWYPSVVSELLARLLTLALDDRPRAEPPPREVRLLQPVVLAVPAADRDGREEPDRARSA